VLHGQTREEIKVTHLFRYAQIVVSKLQSQTKPTSHPGKDLQPYDENSEDNQPYITAELKKNYVNKNRLFTVGDNMVYIRSDSREKRNIKYHNVKLQPDTYYSVFQRTFESEVGGSLLLSGCLRNISCSMFIICFEILQKLNNSSIHSYLIKL
jgi:hypothetical protein